MEVVDSEESDSGTTAGQAEFELPIPTITIHKVLFARSLAQTHIHHIM
jgi:hypothetical protein